VASQTAVDASEMMIVPRGTAIVRLDLNGNIGVKQLRFHWLQICMPFQTDPYGLLEIRFSTATPVCHLPGGYRCLSTAPGVQSVVITGTPEMRKLSAHHLDSVVLVQWQSAVQVSSGLDLQATPSRSPWTMSLAQVRRRTYLIVLGQCGPIEATLVGHNHCQFSSIIVAIGMMPQWCAKIQL